MLVRPLRMRRGLVRQASRSPQAREGSIASRLARPPQHRGWLVRRTVFVAARSSLWHGTTVADEAVAVMPLTGFCFCWTS